MAPQTNRPKRKRKPRPSVERERLYRNPLSLPYMLGSVLAFMPILYAPFLFPVVNRAPTWIAAPIVLGYLALSTWLWMCSAFHLHWFVSRDRVRSVQSGRGASFTRDFENRDFISLVACGPFVIARRSSGKRHVWPRWLRRERATYHWELTDGRLQLRRPAAAASETATVSA